MLASKLDKRKVREACESCGGAERVLDPCPACEGTGYARLRCRGCFRWRPVAEFLRGGQLVQRCSACRRGPEAPRPPIEGSGPLLVKWSPRSHNRKTGPIPVSMTSPRTCPPGCPWRHAGCYGEQYFAGVHFRRLDRGEGLAWDDFCSRVSDLPAGQPWRHNEAGDLPGDGDVIETELFLDLVAAARHTRGFTYTHKPVLGPGPFPEGNAHLIRVANQEGGLVVNLSADSLPHADRLADLRAGPVTVVLPAGRRVPSSTPAGRRVVACPAIEGEGVSCLDCMLCARAGRGIIVGFPAHGSLQGRMSERLLQLNLFG